MKIAKYMKEDITNELDINTKNKDMRDFYRGINVFQKGYKLKTSLANDENDNILQTTAVI
jgi:hypothetical protein